MLYKKGTLLTDKKSWHSLNKGGDFVGQKVNPYGARVGVIFGWLISCISNVNFYLDRKMNRVRFNF